MNELEKHSKTFKQRVVVEEFLDWLEKEKIQLGSYFKDQDFVSLSPILQNRQELLDQYFGVDPVQLDKERRALLKEAGK